VLTNNVLPTLGDRPVTELGRGEIVRLLDDIEDERGPAAAERALGVLRRVLNWHEGRTDDWRSPITKAMSRGKGQARARVLTDDEIRAVWSAASDGSVFGRYIKYLLLTGARRTEAAEMRWAEISDRVWTLPASRNKTGQELARPLSPAALAQLGEPADGWVFSNDGFRPITSFAELKTSFDKRSGVVGYTLHDLRRTCRTLLSRCGVNSDMAERCLGHVIGGIRAVYDKHTFEPEMAAAYAKLAALIEEIVMPPRPKVLTLRKVTHDA
jgi:integrase